MLSGSRWDEIRKGMDLPLWFIMLALFGFGIVALFSASLGVRKANYGFPLKQLLWGLMGVAAYFGVVTLGYKKIMEESHRIYGATLFLLLLVLLMGHTAKGAQSWFSLGPVRIQPSEFGKIGLALFMSRHLCRFPPEDLKSLGLALGFSGISLVLLLLQPDLGSSLVYCAMIGAGLWVAGIKPKYMASLTAAGLSMLPLAWSFLKPYQKMRLMVFIDPKVDPLGAGYNVIQSRIAVGSGGIWGKGFLEGTQGRLHFLPEAHTDFIFSVFAEEFGFLGGLLVILLFAALIWRIFCVAMAAKDLRGKVMCSMVAAWIFFQTFESVAMSMGLAPVTGLPMPFFSYGGSSLLAEFIALGLVQSVAVHTSLERFD
jgi:rod shape determining protein RodA